AESQYIHFQESQCFEVVLIPFQAGTVFHAGIQDGTQFIQSALRNDKTTRMLPQLPRETNILMNQFQGFPQMRVSRIEPLFRQSGFIDVVVPMTTDNARQSPDSIQG